MPKWIPLFRPSQDSHAPCPQIPRCQTGWSADQLGHPFSCKSVFTRTICKITKNFPEMTPDFFPTDQGKPKPLVSWLKDGQPLDTKRVNIRNSDKDSILFIRTSQREDSGVYEITVKVDSFEDKATITLQIVGEPHLHVYMQAHVHRCNHRPHTHHHKTELSLWSLLGAQTSFQEIHWWWFLSRPAWPSYRCEAGGRVGLQCCSGMDSSKG